MHACIHTYIHTYIQTDRQTYIHTHIHTLHYIAIHYITLHFIPFQSITLHYITLHHITLHYIASVIYMCMCTYTHLSVYNNYLIVNHLPFARPQTLQTLQTLPQVFPRQLLLATCPSYLVLKAFKPAVCPPASPPNPPAGLRPFQGNSSLPFAGPQTLQTLQTLPQVFPRQLLLQLHAPAIWF